MRDDLEWDMKPGRLAGIPADFIGVWKCMEGQVYVRFSTRLMNLALFLEAEDARRLADALRMLDEVGSN